LFPLSQAASVATPAWSGPVGTLPVSRLIGSWRSEMYGSEIGEHRESFESAYAWPSAMCLAWIIHDFASEKRKGALKD
jgi:hypothetical protein